MTIEDDVVRKMRRRERPSYLLHAHAASLGGVSDKGRLLGERGAVAVTAVYLQRRKRQRVKYRFKVLAEY